MLAVLKLSVVLVSCPEKLLVVQEELVFLLTEHLDLLLLQSHLLLELRALIVKMELDVSDGVSQVLDWLLSDVRLG